MSSIWLLVAWAGVFLFLAFTAPPYVILASNVTLSIFGWLWRPGGMWVDVHDVAFAALMLGLIVGPNREHKVVPNDEFESAWSAYEASHPAMADEGG